MYGQPPPNPPISALPPYYSFPNPPRNPAPCPPPHSPPPPTWDFGFHRVISILQSPPVGASILAISFFFLLVFSSNLLLGQITSLSVLGITVTIATFALIAALILILFVL